jgi:hypothetical protein
LVRNGFFAITLEVFNCFSIFLEFSDLAAYYTVRPQKFRASFSQFGRISSIAQPKNLLIWGNFAQIERNSPEIFGAKLNCADSPISGEKKNYCVSFLSKKNKSSTKHA